MPLERADGAAELLALLRVRRSGVQCRLREPDGAGGDAEPPGVEGGEGDREALALLADEALARDASTVEDHLRGAGGLRAHLALGCAEGHPGELARGEQARDAAGTLAAGTHHEVVEVRQPAVRDPGLRAGDHVVVAVGRGARLQRGGVGARLRLGQAVRAQQLPGEHVRQPGLLLLRGAVRRQREARQRVHGHADTDREPRVRDLLEHLQVDLVRLSAAAEPLVVGQREQTRLPQRSQRLPGERTVVLGRGDCGCELGVGDLPRQLEQVACVVARQQPLHRARHQSTTSSREVRFTRSPSDSPHTTMSSMRAPCRPRR